VLLKHTPALTHLSLALTDDISGTSEILCAVAKHTHLRQLKCLSLNSFECEGETLRQIICKHPLLQKIDLENLNITGSVSFGDILGTLASDCPRLARVEIRQISQNGFRTVFRSLGDVELSKLYNGPSYDLDFFEDFMVVSKPFRHHATIDDWENLKERLIELQHDVAVTNRQHELRVWYEEMAWIDKEDSYFHRQ